MKTRAATEGPGAADVVPGRPTDTPERASDRASAGSAFWHVYIVANATGALYTGITTDLARRFGEHRASPRGARFFRFAAAARLLYAEQHESRASASRREAAIKRLSRAAKLALIGAAAPDLRQTAP